MLSSRAHNRLRGNRQAGAIRDSRAAMQRHWEGVHLHDRIDNRDRERSSIASQDIDRYIWLSEWRPDFGQSAPGPPGEQMVAEAKVRKKKSVDGSKGRRKTCSSSRCSDDMVHSQEGPEFCDLLRFFSTLDVELQNLLLDAIANHNTKMEKDSTWKDAFVHKQGRKPTFALHKSGHKNGSPKAQPPAQLGRSCSTARPNPNPAEVLAPCSFREWTDHSKQPSACDYENIGANESSNIRSQTAEWTSNTSCRLTNSSGPLRGGCGKTDTEDEGLCRDVAVQTRRSLRKGSTLNHIARGQSREVAKSLADHSSQTSSRREYTGTEHAEEDIESLREQTTVDVLQRWAEPLEQYLSNLQKFEEELRAKWLTPEEIETTPISGAQTDVLDFICIQNTSDPLWESKTQMLRLSSDEIEAHLDEPLSNRKHGGASGDELASRSELTHHEVYEPVLGKSKEENSAVHESGIKAPEKSELRPTDKHFIVKPRAERAAANSLADGSKCLPRDSDSFRGKPKHEYLASDFRTRKLVEWWPTSDKPLQATKSKSAPAIFSSKPQVYTVYDPSTLLVKTKQNQIPADKLGVKARQKPEWWPALRRPYSASEIETMRPKEDTEKATRKSPIKIVTGYPVKRLPQSSNKSQRWMTEAIELTRKKCTSECMARQDDGALKRTLQMRTAPSPPPLPLRKSHQEEHCQKMEELQKAYGHFQKRDGPRNLSTVNELGQLTARKSPKCKTGHGGLHALQEHNQFKMQRPTLSTGITVEHQACGIITHLRDQVCGIVTQFQPEQEVGVAAYLLHQIKTPRESNIQAGALPQNNAQEEFPIVAPVVELRNEDKKTRKKRNRSNSSVQRGIERLADKLIDQAVNEVASELAEFCETVADQMYTAEFVT